MKKLLIVLAITISTLNACTGVKSVTKGIENQSYIEFYSAPGSYFGGVDVTIDETNSFKAEVKKTNAKRPKGSVYAISTGKHTVIVKYNNEVIYSKQIFVSSQETKTITLP